MAVIESMEDKGVNDPILEAMEKLVKDYADQGVFTIDEKEYTTQELMEELRNNTDTGFKFRTTVNEMIMTYLMKFKG